MTTQRASLRCGPVERDTPPDSVLNGIAYDASTRRIYITGKKWPRLYQITVEAGL